jgi:hypothetical protein
MTKKGDAALPLGRREKRGTRGVGRSPSARSARRLRGPAGPPIVIAGLVPAIQGAVAPWATPLWRLLPRWIAGTSPAMTTKGDAGVTHAPGAGRRKKRPKACGTLRGRRARWRPR